MLDRYPDIDGHIVELLRAANHIRDFQRLFASLGVTESEDLEDVAADLENDSIRILVLNFSAAQLREALKAFWKLSAQPSFARLLVKMPKPANSRIEVLRKVLQDFKEQKGLLHSILKPLRDKSFHYDPDAAQSWVRERMGAEREPKPPISFIDFKRRIFGPGIEFDEAIYSQHLFWGEGPHEGLLKAQMELWELQETFLLVAADVADALFKDAGVPKDRAWGWLLEHRYGLNTKGEPRRKK